MPERNLRSDLQALAPKAGKAVYRRIMLDRERGADTAEAVAAEQVLRLVSGARLPRECEDPGAVRQDFQGADMARELRQVLAREPGLSPLIALDRLLGSRLGGGGEDPCVGFLLQVARESVKQLREHSWLPEGASARYLRQGETAKAVYEELAASLEGKTEAKMLGTALRYLEGREIDGKTWRSPWSGGAVPKTLLDLESRLDAEFSDLGQGEREFLTILSGYLKNALPGRAPSGEVLAALDDWIVRGRAGNRLYKTLRRDSELAACVMAWKGGAGERGAALEQRLVRAFFAPISRIVVEGREVEVGLPRFGEMGLGDIKPLLARLQAEGGFGTDARVWKVVAVAFEFLDKECGLSRSG